MLYTFFAPFLNVHSYTVTFWQYAFSYANKSLLNVVWVCGRKRAIKKKEGVGRAQEKGRG